MKSIQELYKFYREELMQDIEVLEEQRKALANKVFTVLAVIAAIAFVIAGLIMMYSHDKGQVMFPAIGGIVIGGIVYTFMIKGYACEFKEKVIKRLVGFIDPNLKYNANGCIDERTYMNSDIFRKRPDRYHGDDLVSGTLDKTQIKFSEVHSQYETRDKDGHRHYHTIFKGLLFVGDFNKHFKGRTYVLPDFAEKSFGKMIGGMFQGMNKGRGELIKLEDVEFEKEFAVYGDDQIEARYILTHSLMARMTEFQKKAKKKLYFSFIGSNVYVAIPYTKDLFEPKIFKTLIDFEPIQEYYEDLAMAIGIVEELNLNTRIWTKE